MAARKLDIETYNAKRDFAKTGEPKGRKLKGKGDSFVVQKHDASRLHWDFRLELDGVLKSWAVPRGPSLNPKDNRLAVRTEDHPIDYGSFEGTIPKGEYGGGTVMLWDQGRWIHHPDKDPRKTKGGLVIQDDDKSDPAKGSNVIDLMAALKKSLGAGEGTRSDTVKPVGKRPVSKAKPAAVKKVAVAKKRA